MSTDTSNSNSRQIWRDFLLRTFWYGGSTFDAWLNIASIKVSARILTLPHSTAELGLPSALVIYLLQAAIGLWSSCMIKVLYFRHKRSSGNENKNTTQLHEVIRGVLGPRWGMVSLFLNIGLLFTISTVQLLSCASIVYVLDDEWEKRTWVLVLGALFSLSIFTPTAHNYRVLSFVGVVSTVCSSIYLAIASLLQGKAADVKYSGPQSFTGYFTSIADSTFLGSVIVPVEIMDGMWKPHEFPIASFYGTMYTLVAAVAPNICIYTIFGDKALTSLNALELVPDSSFRDAAAVLMLIHQFIVFGIYSMGVYTTCEKLLGVHNAASFSKRTACRVPVFLALWLAALAFPFFERLIPVVGTLAVCNLFVIPCAAYIAVFWGPYSRRQSAPFSRLGWTTDLSVNFGVILWSVIVNLGLGVSFSSIELAQTLKHARLFAKCYACTK